MNMNMNPQPQTPPVPAYRYGQVSPPSSTKPSLQSHAVNDESIPGFSRISRSTTMGQSQAQMALYYDGPQVASPPAMVSSPYIQPSRQSTHTEDPMFIEWKRQERLRQLEEQRQKEHAERRMQTPERQYSQQNQQQQTPPPQQYPQQNNQQQEQRQQTPEQHQIAAQSPFPRPGLPAHLQRRMPRGDDSFYSSPNASMDDYDQQFPGNFVPQRPYIHDVRPGHTYGKVTVRGNAKVLMGNGISDKSRGLERQHTFGDVDIDNEANLRQGDMYEDQIAAWFARPPRN